MYLHIYITHTHIYIFICIYRYILFSLVFVFLFTMDKFEYEGNMINAYVCQKSYVNLSIQSIFPALLDKRNWRFDTEMKKVNTKREKEAIFTTNGFYLFFSTWKVFQRPLFSLKSHTFKRSHETLLSTYRNDNNNYRVSKGLHCVKRVQELFLVRMFLYLDWIRR